MTLSEGVYSNRQSIPSYGGRGWLKTSEYGYMGKGSKIAKKKRHIDI